MQCSNRCCCRETRHRELLLAAFFAIDAVAMAQSRVAPARYLDGALPSIPVQAVGGGEVLLELAVDNRGHVGSSRTLRATPPFTDGLSQVVRGWQFAPAESDLPPAGTDITSTPSRIAVPSKVLVAGQFRPPSINTPTLGEAATDVAQASSETPFPLTTVMPPYPPLAREGGTVLVEVHIDSRGAVVDAKAVRSASPFDEPALAAARQWTFRPARLGVTPVDTLAYIVFAFRQPITGAGRR